MFGLVTKYRFKEEAAIEEYAIRRMHLVFSQKTGSGRQLYEYLSLRREQYSVQAICKVLEISESGILPLAEMAFESTILAAAPGPYTNNI